MQVKCPRCSNWVEELLSCDVCKTVGCIRCIVRYSKQWVCEKCKSVSYGEQTPESALAAMFG